MSIRSLALIFIFLFSGSVFAANPHLPIKQISRDVDMQDITVYSVGSSLSRCVAWEDDNSYDGKCLDYIQYCDVFVQVSGADIQGISPTYRLMDPVRVNTGEDCATTAANKQRDWKIQAASAVVNEKIYDEGVRWIYLSDLGGPLLEKTCGHGYSIDGGVTIGKDYFVAKNPVVVSLDKSFCQK